MWLCLEVEVEVDVGVGVDANVYVLVLFFPLHFHLLSSFSLCLLPFWRMYCQVLHGMSKFFHEQMYCTKQRFVVQYVELQRVYGRGLGTGSVWSGGWLNVLNEFNGGADSSTIAHKSDSGGVTTRVIDAHCYQQDVLENTMNDNPLDCLVKDLKPGKGRTVVWW